MNRSEFLKMMGVAAVTPVLESFSNMAKANTSENKEQPIITNQEAIVDKPVTAIVIGAGARGTTYAGYAKQYPNSLQIVGVSDILADRKATMAAKYNIPKEHQFGDWSEVFKIAKFADAVIISTPDDVHYEPCMKALEMGYDVLLEKPIAQSIQECVNIAAQVRKYNRIAGVCHVLRYAPYFIALKKVLDEGVIGEIVSMQHLEAIRFYHFAIRMYGEIGETPNKQHR